MRGVIFGQQYTDGVQDFFLPTSYFFSFLLLHIRPDLLYQKKLVFYQLAENRHPAILRFVCIEMGYLFLKICYKQQNYISQEQNMNAIDKNNKFKLSGIWNPLKVTHKSSRINYYPFAIVYRQRNSPFFHVEYQPLAPRSTPCSSSPFFWRGIKKNRKPLGFTCCCQPTGCPPLLLPARLLRMQAGCQS